MATEIWVTIGSGNGLLPVPSCNCLCAIYWIQVLSPGDTPTTSEWSTILLYTKVHLILEVWRQSISMDTLHFITPEIWLSLYEIVVSHHVIYWNYKLVFTSVKKKEGEKVRLFRRNIIINNYMCFVIWMSIHVQSISKHLLIASRLFYPLGNIHYYFKVRIIHNKK